MGSGEWFLKDGSVYNESIMLKWIPNFVIHFNGYVKLDSDFMPDYVHMDAKVQGVPKVTNGFQN